MNTKTRIESLEVRMLLAGNAISAENALPGTPPSTWDIVGSGDATIQGFAADISYNVGQTVQFKINDTSGASYHIDIYRMGYYQGLGARRVGTIASNATLRLVQPAPLKEASSGLVDCGNWGVSATWQVPSTAVSGIYFAKVIRDDNGGASHVLFVVRNDASTSNLFFKTSDATWQAYNTYGGNSLYDGTAPSADGRAYKVSYNRPILNRSNNDKDASTFYAEYPMVRWLEENGYDVSYTTDVDTARAGALIKQHKVFMSVGHDEYWSGEERANVESARDAGVNLAFFSGNEVFWKTRWENSIDSTADPYHTLVCYKETHDNSLNNSADPNTWTGSWADPRFSPPTDGGRPQNALTGVLFTVNRGPNSTGTPMTVPGAYAGLRFWRNTSVASLPPSGSATLGDGVLGYEWDEDVDNGFRPAGLFDLSSTTQAVTEKFRDYGNIVAPGTATHSLTLYRAPSGALVFGSGTVQWSWGLDGDHDGGDTIPDPAMQQATINLFADMGAQPATLQAGMVPATASTDFAVPHSLITSPAAGATLRSGTPVTVTGTALDSGGGAVAAVEVSADGGVTWHPATGRATWTYTWNPGPTGSITLLSRAVDDSGNLEHPTTGVTVTVAPPLGTLSLWPTSATPTVSTSSDGSAIEVGVRFRSDISGYVTGVRFYKGTGNTGTHIGHLWSASGQLLASATFTGETTSGWQTVTFANPVQIAANTTYVASYHSNTGHYANDIGYFATTKDAGPLHALADTGSAHNGLYAYSPSGAFPDQSFDSTNYWVDVTFAATVVDNTPPVLTDRNPAPNSVGFALSAPITATFSESVQPASISFTLTDTSNHPVAANLSYDDSTRTATLTPAAPLTLSTTYIATISGAKDLAGNVMAAPSAWSFTTASAAGTGVFSLWTDAATPVVTATTDPNSVEVGVRFRSDVSGFVTGIRFYKGTGNTGTHIGHLWSASGQLLASATFTGETASGWQTVTFATPVQIAANTTYVASYLAPVGHYPADGTFFATAGVDSGPIHALSDLAAGGNGVYTYSSAGAFPTQTFNATNYWVDVVFDTSLVDTTPPAVTSRSPGPGDINVPAAGTAINVTFSESILPGTLSFSLRDAANNPISTTFSYSEGTHTATWTPTSALNLSSSYTATVSGAQDLAGNPMPLPVTWTFTTADPAAPGAVSLWSDATTPANTSVSDSGSIELGLKFRADTSGAVMAVRFYKGAGNTGTHVGHLWSADGTLLASVTFTNETASGWQQATFSKPVPIATNTTYVISYYAPAGHYAVSGGFFTSTGADSGPVHALSSPSAGGNGLYRYGTGGGFPTNSFNDTNYWVDVVYDTRFADTTPPVLTSKTPAAGATGIATGSAATATFSEPINLSTLSFVLKDAGGNAVPATVAYDGATNTATLSPQTRLNPGTQYTATVSGAKDTAGNVIVTQSWSFTTSTATSLWTDATTPADASVSDSGAVELGVKFRTDTSGAATAVRFYKGSANIGTHVGHLWAADGTLLGSVTFTNETASGWQQANFSAPIGLAAGATYIVSYYAPSGGYAANGGYFASAGADSGPVHALSSPAAGGNGLYRYGTGGGFPASTFNATNYWVDVVFDTNFVDTTPPALTSKSPAAGATDVAPGSAVTATFSELIQSSTLIFTLKDGNGNTVPATVVYDSVANSATLTPLTALTASASYTATVSGAKDGSGNTMAPVTWSFTIAAATTAQTYSLWTSAATPATASSSDGNSIELGLKFTTDVAGTVTGVRFYKGSANIGTHVGHLWAADGSLLGSVTFTNETASGWQQANFSAPIALTAGATYVVSYYAPSGGYSATGAYFASAGADSGPVHALSSPAAGGNGVYRYNTGGGFPNNSFNATNYWVDVVFQPSSGSGGQTQQLVQTTAADFGSGTNSGTAITSTSGGEVQLAALSDDFAGTSLGAAWATTSWVPAGGGPTAVGVAGSIVSIGGAEVLSTMSVASAAAVDGSVKFAAAPFQHFGLATDFASLGGNYWAMFSTGNTSDTLFARVNANGATQDVSLGALPSGFHLYKVRQIATGFEFYVDGVLKTTVTAAFPSGVALKAGMSSYTGTALQADSVHLNSTAGTYLSSVLDAGRTVAWGTGTWNASIPAGAGLVIEVSSGNSIIPDGSWSAWSVLTNGGTISAPTGRYLRYRVTFTASASGATPVFQDFTITWT